MKKKILITGGLGYIGSHVAVELIEQGFECIIADNLSNTRIEVLDAITEITGTKPIFAQIDLRDKLALSEFVASIDNIAAVIHFAGFKAVGESMQEPLKYYQNNLVSMLNMMEVMKVRNIHNFVFSSSATVYGEADIIPVTEATPTKRATNPYGMTKQMGEDFIQDYSIADKNFKSIILRYFNPIGAHPSAKIGELPAGIPANIAPFITQAAIGKREELSVFGGDYNTPDGTGIRDYIHVVDLAKAHIASIKRLLEDKSEASVEIFNIGTGHGNSVLELIKAFEKVSGKKLKYKITDRRPGDIAELYAATTLANEKLHWKSQYNIEQSMLSAWNWEQNINKNK